MKPHSLRFLVVEDNDFQRRTLVRYLRGLGAAEVAEAADGHEALRLLESGKPADLIICDLQMPGMDGMELLRRLHEVGCESSVVLVSALDRRLLGSIAAMTEAYGLNLLGIVEKPLTRGKLLELVNKHVAQPVPVRRTGTLLPVFTADEVRDAVYAGQIEPFFQPKVAIASNTVTAVEALARWRHPDHGIVPPAAFIGLLEHTEGIDDLTYEMLRLAAAACTDWQARGHDLTFSVNLSLSSLDAPEIAERLARIVAHARLTPTQFMFEITESAAATHAARALETLARIRMWGFGLSIDDYGTGYSSMQQLTRIAFNELKIDRSFVTSASNDPSAEVILSSSIDMARRLGIAAVAEGVETEGDWLLLKSLGCTLAQGYLISRPMPAADTAIWLEERRQMR